MNEWALETTAQGNPASLADDIRLAFSRDSTRVLTIIDESSHFSVWSVPDGQLMAANRGSLGSDSYRCADFGVPESASDGLVGFSSHGTSKVDLWDVDVSPPGPPEGGPSRPRLRSRVDLASDGRPDVVVNCLAYSPDGSRLAAACGGVAHVYDVASLTPLAAYASPSRWSVAAWAPDGRHVLVSWDDGAVVWDFNRPEAPSAILTTDVGPHVTLHSWSPNGVSYFVIRKSEGRFQSGPVTYALEERRVS